MEDTLESQVHRIAVLFMIIFSIVATLATRTDSRSAMQERKHAKVTLCGEIRP
jgi:hypothetical protein